MSVGSVLSEARLSAGLTVDQIAERTCIRRTLVENIEADDFHACGGDFYARGHVKSIAQALHIDPAPLLAEFDHDHVDPDLPTASGVLDTERSAETGHRADGRSPNWTAAMVVALVGVLAFGAFHVLTSGGGTPTGATSAGGPTVAATSPSAGGNASASASDTAAGASTDEATPDGSAPTDAIAAAQGRGVTVVLAAVEGRSWISATGKETGTLYQDVLDTGQEKTVRDDRQVKLVLGNAGAVHLVVNGRDLGSPGSEGQVVRLTFGPGDPTLATG